MYLAIFSGALLLIFVFFWFPHPGRRYTKFYGTSEGAAQDLVHDALMSMYLWFGCVLYSNVFSLLIA